MLDEACPVRVYLLCRVRLIGQMLNNRFLVLMYFPYDLARTLRKLFLLAVLSAWAQSYAVPVTITLSDLTPSYTGTGRNPTVTSNPTGKTVGLAYYTRASENVYSTIPTTLPTTSYSVGFKESGIDWMGDYVSVGGSGRVLEYIDVVLVTTAKASAWPTLAVANSTGYTHNLSISVRDYAPPNAIIASIGKQVLVPWVPESESSLVFKVRFEVIPTQTLSPTLLILLNVPNSRTGSPASGPYDFLKFAVADTAPSVGGDISKQYFYTLVGNANYYSSSTIPNTSTYLTPQISVRASTISTTLLTNSPINAGDYFVKATVASPDTGEAAAFFSIRPAAATVTLTNLTQVANGSAKSATVVTSPVGLTNNVTYNGSSIAPSAAGKYPVVATITNPNYVGSATGELAINQQFSNWISGYVTGGSVPSGQATDTSDPDKDGVINQLEYAFDTLPGSSSSGNMPALEYSGGVMSVVYRKNTLATDLTYQVQVSTVLTSGWTDVTTTDTVVSTSGYVQTIRATVPTTSDLKRFIRLKVNKN